MNKFIPTLLIISLFFISGCSSIGTYISVSKHPDAKEVLRLDEDANIFQWEGIIYQSEIDWVNELDLEKREPIGEITASFTNENDELFKNGMATVIPIGTKIYSTSEDGILMIEYNGEEKYFLSLTEG